MEDLKKLVEEYFVFITNVLISESELYDNYCDLANKKALEEARERGNIGEFLDSLILKDILYDLTFNQKNIERDLKNAQDFFYEEYSKNEIIEIYNKIKKVFPDFFVEYLEKII